MKTNLKTLKEYVHDFEVEKWIRDFEAELRAILRRSGENRASPLTRDLIKEILGE